MAGAVLKLLALSKVFPHPDNPRVSLREDVVSAIAANLDGEYPQKHAIHVRPIDPGFQVLSGHQRVEAATRKGLSEIWAWVEDVDDSAAFMELATSNNQGELSPLEIGIHAFKAVPKAEGGRGKKGGLSEYAERIGKSQGYVSQVRLAAEVATSLGKPISQLIGLLDRAQHLCAIHKLPQGCWQSACEYLASKDLSVADVESRVAQAMEFLKEPGIASDWSEYLPDELCASAVFQGSDPNNFRRLWSTVEAVFNKLPEDLAEEWRAWLIENRFGDSWDMRKVQSKRTEFEDRAWEMENSGQQQTVISLLLADPPWQYDFAETDNRQVENQYPTATVEEITKHINAPWVPPLSADCVLFLWATAPKLREALRVIDAWGFEYKTCAVWDKEKIGMGYWFRGQHELLLVATRGNSSPPTAELRVSSVFREQRKKHSAKPECVYSAIEKMFPDYVKGEMYQRTKRDGWIGFGNES